MRTISAVIIICFGTFGTLAQSARVAGYSESVSRYDDKRPLVEKDPSRSKPPDDIVRIDTDLVTIPVRITSKKGGPVPDVRREEVKVFENGIEQSIDYFSSQEEPFTVALMLDMSYSTVFKLRDIQDAALAFVRQLRPQDKAMVVAFDEKVKVL